MYTWVDTQSWSLSTTNPVGSGPNLQCAAIWFVFPNIISVTILFYFFTYLYQLLIYLLQRISKSMECKNWETSFSGKTDMMQEDLEAALRVITQLQGVSSPSISKAVGQADLASRGLYSVAANDIFANMKVNILSYITGGECHFLKAHIFLLSTKIFG